MAGIVIAFLIIVISIIILKRIIRNTSIQRWIIPCILNSNENKKIIRHELQDIYICICDHYQPFYGNVSQEIAEHRVVTWCKEYSKIITEHKDFDGRSPVHTFFYCEQDYSPKLLDSLAKLSREGIADVEILIAHQNDTATNFARKIEEFRDVLFHHHGLLRKDSEKLTFGFIHGYWALNNSRPDKNWCGVDCEIPILKQAGCYADFTYPSAPDPTQPSIINSIYFAENLPGRSRSHEYGYRVKKYLWSDKDLLLIQGPLALNWKKQAYGILPGLENGEISASSPFSPERVDLWINSGIGVEGVSNHSFIKLYTHGGIDQNIRYFFGEEGLPVMWEYLEKNYNDGSRYRLHYVSAWEMYNIIKKLCLKTEIIQNRYIGSS
jgi:hypothetical protein